MAPDQQPDPPTELVYLPEPSWVPALTATGIALILAGLFVGWVLIVIGALIFVPTLWSWIRSTRESLSRLPRRQRPVTAVLPPAPPTRIGGE
jgi:hypothetical protein